jgi:hypothetical protein
MVTRARGATGCSNVMVRAEVIVARRDALVRATREHDVQAGDQRMGVRMGVRRTREPDMMPQGV